MLDDYPYLIIKKGSSEAKFIRALIEGRSTDCPNEKRFLFDIVNNPYFLLNHLIIQAVLTFRFLFTFLLIFLAVLVIVFPTARIAPVHKALSGPGEQGRAACRTCGRAVLLPGAPRVRGGVGPGVEGA